MMVNFKSKLLYWLEDTLGWQRRKTVSARILDRHYEVLDGSIRGNTDYDDAWLLALAQDARVVFDVGCNIGQSSLILLYPENVRRIVMIDPNPRALAAAAENIFRNHLSTRAQFLCAFVSDQTDTQITFHTVGAGAAGSMYASMAVTASSLSSEIQSSTITLDALASQTGLSPDFVKIDVEGAEVRVLQGARKIASGMKARFFVEMHSNDELPMAENAEEVLAWCRECGYQAYYLKEHVLLESTSQVAHRGRCHLLLLPQGQAYPERLSVLEQGASLEAVTRSGEQLF